LGVPANGLTHHVLEWRAADPGAVPGPAATVLLLHGFMDAAASWDLVAPVLADDGLRVIAPDLRGFGEGPRVPPGGYYHFADYVFDVADIVEALVPPASPLVLVGHSMGGTVATLFAGAFPERPSAVALLEGLGPPDQNPDDAPMRMRAWIDGVRSVRARGERALSSREDALRRLAGNHPRVSPDVLSARLDGLMVQRPSGRLAWRADSLHTTRAPVPFFAKTFCAFARRVTCPVLFVSGGPLGWHPPDEEERLASFSQSQGQGQGQLEHAELTDAGHMMHWTQPVALAALLSQFVRRACGDRPGQAIAAEPLAQSETS
jgi:pimeloyl-ACP methyl ester carboxylesterase